MKIKTIKQCQKKTKKGNQKTKYMKWTPHLEKCQLQEA